MTPADFAEPGPFFRMGRAPIGIDILTAIEGVEFDAAWERRIEAACDQETSLRANFISRDDLIAAKRAAGRLQDLADIEAIENAAKANQRKP
jgi:hypothetical protein